jgi:hypothetical protein
MEVVPILEESWYAEILVEQVKVVHAEAVASYRNLVNNKARDIFETINEAVVFIRNFVVSTPVAKKSAFKVESRKVKKFDNKKKGKAGKPSASEKGAAGKGGAGKIKSIQELRKGSGARRDKATGQMKYPGKCRTCQNMNASGDWLHWHDECPNNPKNRGRDESDGDESDGKVPEHLQAAVAYLLKGKKKVKTETD